MKIYAVRDRLIDHFATPFAGHEDKEVLQAIAANVNRENSNDPIAQAPHHFEIWKLGEVDDLGHINAHREFLADASTLVRARRPPPGPGQGQIPGITGGGRIPAGRGPGQEGTDERAPPGPTQATDRHRAPADPKPERTAEVGKH